MNEKRVARICWNTNFWQKPSGKKGKSQSNDTHEHNFGFGGEEWLFNLERSIDGYQYGFLEPIHQRRETFMGKTFDIGLYAIDGNNKNRYWIGEIQNVYVIEDDEIEKVAQKYKSNGWFDEMRNELSKVGVDNLGGFGNEITMNIRFREEDVKTLETPLLIDKGEGIWSVGRYTLLTDTYYPNFEEIKNGKGFVFSPSKPLNPLPAREYEQLSKRVELNDRHREICMGLYKVLVKEWGKQNVGCEQNIGNGCKVDLVIKKQDAYSFIEVKTFVQLRYSIRMAIGQLLEYAYWIGDKDIAELIIVGFQAIDKDEIEYLNRLRDKVNLNIHYWQFADGRIIKH